MTTAISGQLPSSTFATMTELVAAVGSNYGSDYVIVETRAASTDAPATTTLDFLAADDVLRGRRLVIEGSTDGTTYTIQSIAEIPLCRRGLSETGRCI